MDGESEGSVGESFEGPDGLEGVGLEWRWVGTLGLPMRGESEKSCDGERRRGILKIRQGRQLAV
jgi:hypothetical protein